MPNPKFQPDPTLPPTVVEIRCPCRPERKNCFNVRTRQSEMRKTCHLCNATYIVRLFSGGAVKVTVLPSLKFEEEAFAQYSIVTDGE